MYEGRSEGRRRRSNASRALLSVSAGALVLLALLLALTACAVALAQSSTDYDADDDGLIEVASAAQLNAIRWDLDGDGSPASANASGYSSAFPNAATGMGCPSSDCTGYELTANLDLDVAPYNAGAGWEPIGTSSASFSATFEGNSKTISGLFINRPAATTNVGLFGDVGSIGVIRNVGLTSKSVTGRNYVGGLVGDNSGTITASYSTHDSRASSDLFGGSPIPGSTVGNRVGGLVGVNRGTIAASYSTVLVVATDDPQTEAYIGGLVGGNGGTITASYATGAVGDFVITRDRPSHVGGLVGGNGGTITASYATGAASGPKQVGGLVGVNSGTIKTSYSGLVDWLARIGVALERQPPLVG